MRVIRRDELEVTCPNCNGVLGVRPNDIIYDDVGIHKFEFGIQCILCNKYIEIYKECIPKHWLLHIT